MKNTLSPILQYLEDQMNAQPKNSRSWTAEGEVCIIAEPDKGLGEFWWVKLSSAAHVFDEDAKLNLVKSGALVSKDCITNKRFGKTSQYAYPVNITKLRQAVRDIENEASEIQRLKKHSQELHSQLKKAREANATDAAMARLIETIRTNIKPRTGDFESRFIRDAQPGRQTLAGVPSLFLSDWHWGEVVQPAQVQYMNEYNLAVANGRADRVFKTSLEMLFNHQSGMAYDGFMLILGGNLFNGGVSDELRSTNDAPIHECLLSLAEKLAQGIIELADNFEMVYVPCVVGAQSRPDAKKNAKNAVTDTYDWLLYNFVNMLVQGKMGERCNVEFEIAPALDLNFSIYNTRYLLTHGEPLGTKGGDESVWSSMMKVAHRKQQRTLKSGGESFDYMLCTHLHKYGSIANVISNGSLKGYDEMAYKKNSEYERPIQALWITHPDHGIISHMPIYADEYQGDDNHNAPPITPGWGLRKKR
ncbi:hypothetical protein LC612_30530 [Nostoc sp. CHAB 5834]|nr:hypothetical protein [Nostoc sp. CHAB 5834]